MKTILRNTGYFLKEVKTIIKTNMMSSIFSLFSTVLIFFFLTMVIAGWWISSRVVETIKGDAEISVYYSESADKAGVLKLAEKIKGIDGVENINMVDEKEAYGRMEKILGKDAQVMKFFDENPFGPFMEVKINLEKMDTILKSINSVEGVEYVRDNRSVLYRIQSISAVLKLLGYLVIIAVGVSTIVIISHIIRLGIYNSREQISTLKLLGAPGSFIAFPFLLEGLLLTLGGGMLAAALASLSLNYVYAKLAGPLPFIPLPPLGELVPGLVLLVILLSAFLGIAGSLFGISSSKNN